MFPSYHSIGMTDFTLPCSSLRPPNTSLCSSTQEVPSPRALSTPCFEYVFLNFGTQNSVRTCVKLPYVHIYIYRCHIKPVKPHHAVCKKASPNGEPIIGLLTLLSFPVSTSKTKKGNGSFECQDRPALRSSENPSQDVATVKDCKVQQ